MYVPPALDTPDSPFVLHSPADLAVELPALIGFHPEQSIVVVLTDRDTVRVTLRWDLGPELAEMAIRTIAIAHRAEADGAILAVYSPCQTVELPYAAEVEAFTALLEEQGIRVRDALLIDSGRWWSYSCDDPGCCPPEGTPIQPSASRLDSARALSGRPVAASSRDQVAAAYQVDPERLIPQEALDAAGDSLARHDGLGRGQYAFGALQTLAEAIHRPGQHEDIVEELGAVLALALQEIPVRDYLLGRAVLGWTDLAAPAAALVRATLTAPPELSPACAAAAMALLAADGGNPVALWAMADHARGESLADLVRAGVEHGLSPDAVRDVLAQVLPDVEHQLTDPA